MVLNGHFDGQRVVLDDPVPADVPAHTRVKVLFEEVGGEENALAGLARLAISTDEYPPDYSEQHDHYVKGTPRK